MPQKVARKWATYGASADGPAVCGAASITQRSLPLPWPFRLCHLPSHGPMTSSVGTGSDVACSHFLLNDEQPIDIRSIDSARPRRIPFIVMRGNPNGSVLGGNGVSSRRRFLRRREEFQPDDAAHDHADADDAHDVAGLVEEDDAEDGRPYGADAGPDCVRGPDRQRLHRLREQPEAQEHDRHRPDARPELPEAVRVLQADRPGDLTESGED